MYMSIVHIRRNKRLLRICNHSQKVIGSCPKARFHSQYFPSNSLKNLAVHLLQAQI